MIEEIRDERLEKIETPNYECAGDALREISKDIGALIYDHAHDRIDYDVIFNLTSDIASFFEHFLVSQANTWATRSVAQDLACELKDAKDKLQEKGGAK